MRSYQDPSRWWGGQGRSEDPLSLLDLVRNGTLDLELASLLWLLVEKKVSIIVAASPQRAGKTTLLSTLIDFMPPWFERVYTTGRDEDFSFLPETDPSKTYVMVPELSDHTPAYLWGERLRTLFEALGEGYSMAATMHADSPQEVVAMLREQPVSVPGDLIASIGVVVNLVLLSDERETMRRVARVSLVSGDSDYVPMARWDSAEDTFTLNDSAENLAALAGRLGMASRDIRPDLGRRAERLGSWLKSGPTGGDEVQRMVAEYYQAR